MMVNMTPLISYKETIMAQKKKIDDDVRKDINDIYDLLNSIKQSIDILTKVAETIADNTADRTGFRRK